MKKNTVMQLKAKQALADAKVGSGLPGPGRPKGLLNKATRQFKDALLDTFEELGGVEHLKKWAENNPTEFYRIMGRTLPIEAKTEIRNPDGVLLANINLSIGQYLEARQNVIDNI